MCGIIGVASKEYQAIPILLHGLENLEYRGYDSAGLAFFQKKKIEIRKTKGRISALKEKIGVKEKAKIGIGHTRWATHGEANEINAHPHRCGKITIVHNGIIENYQELKGKLISYGYSFSSMTDTEVACALLSFYYEKTNSIKKAIQNFMKEIKGSYAIALLCDDEMDTIYALKKESPFILASSDDGNYIASDIPAILDYSNSYYILDDFEYAMITAQKITIYDRKGNLLTKEEKQHDGISYNNTKGNYPHFMLKEIMEQPTTVWLTMEPYLKEGVSSLKLLPNLAKYEKIDVVACGTAWHAGLVGKFFIEEYGEIPVDVCLASEYRYKKLFLSDKTLVIFISQSGETADTLAALKRVKEEACDTLGIINTKNSAIARLVDQVLYTQAGVEIAVASTKAFTSQVAILILLSLALAYQKKSLNEDKILEIIEELKTLPKELTELLKQRKQYQDLAKELSSRQDIFYLGRGLDYALMMEGSLKLKEISYIPSVCYAAGELKHGTISLISKGTPILASCTNEKLDFKTISNLKETKARGAILYLITNNESLKSDPDLDHLILLKKTSDFLVPFLVMIPLQFIAYEVAVLCGCDIDKPRNLAKSVTVE